AAPDLRPAVGTTTAAPAIAQPHGFASTVGESRAGAYRVGPVDQVTTGYQRLPVYRDGLVVRIDDKTYPRAVATITVYRTGVFDPGAFTNPGQGRTSVPLKLAERQALIDGKKVAWPYAADSWATLVPSEGKGSPDLSDAAKIIDSIAPAPERPVRAPYSFGFLPPGWRVVSAGQAAPGLSDQISRIALQKGDLTRAQKQGPVDETVPYAILKIVAVPQDTSRERIRCVSHYCTMILDRGHEAELQGIGTGPSVPEIRRILAGLRFADVADQSTWIEVL
ncbi:hypothetical protein AB0J83_32355, partial [Actinoplanes sp. NPDC049596]